MCRLNTSGRAAFVYPAFAVAIAVSLIISCGSSRLNVPVDQRRTASFWRPYLLYLKDMPHSSLYVEIDAVEGTEPGRSDLERLRTFLEQYCDKPDGIDIALGPPIPASAAEGESEASLALKYLDGPPAGETEQQPAFLYILYYDSRLCGSSDGRADGGGPGGTGWLRWSGIANRWNGIADTWGLDRNHPTSIEAKKPHIRLLPYPSVIFIDRHYDPWGHDMWDLFLLHEVGHVLGLARGLDHGDGMHCDDPRCLMNAKARMGFFRWLIGRDRPRYQHDLCEKCTFELRRYRDLPADPDLRFVGPLLVRSERAYHVLSLPGFVELYVGPLERLEPGRVLKDAHDLSANLRTGGVWVNYRSGLTGGQAGEALSAALRHAGRDPYELIRRIAERQAATVRLPRN